MHWYIIYILKSDWWGVSLAMIFIEMFNWGGGEVLPAFSGIGCAVPDVVSIYSIWNVLCESTVSTFVDPLWCFCPRNFFLKKRIEVVTIIFTYWTQDHQHECFIFSNRFSSLWLGRWMNHLLPVWWSDCMFMFLNDGWCVYIVKRNFLLLFSFHYGLYTLPKFNILFVHSYDFTLKYFHTVYCHIS